MSKCRWCFQIHVLVSKPKTRYKKGDQFLVWINDCKDKETALFILHMGAIKNGITKYRVEWSKFSRAVGI